MTCSLYSLSKTPWKNCPYLPSPKEFWTYPWSDFFFLHNPAKKQIVIKDTIKNIFFDAYLLGLHLHHPSVISNNRHRRSLLLETLPLFWLPEHHTHPVSLLTLSPLLSILVTWPVQCTHWVPGLHPWVSCHCCPCSLSFMISSNHVTWKMVFRLISPACDLSFIFRRPA